MILLLRPGARKGRGLIIEERVFPNLSLDTQKLFVSLSGELTKLPLYFERATFNFEPDVPSRGFMEVTIGCKDAKFELKPSDAERFYTDLFYEYLADSQKVFERLSLLMRTNVAGQIREFGEVVTFRPKENPQELIPIFPMREIWSRLYVLDFYGINRRGGTLLSNLVQTKGGILSKDEVDLLEQMATLQKDYRTFISKHAEKIIALNRKIQGGESWEAGFKRDGGKLMKDKIDTLMKEAPEGNEIPWFFTPLSEGDVSAMTDFTSRMLSAIAEPQSTTGTVAQVPWNFCSKCGSRLSPDWAFCGACGGKVG